MPTTIRKNHSHAPRRARYAAFALGAVALFLLPHASAAIIPEVVNGNFELGTTGWTHGGVNGGGLPPTLVSSCAANGGTMALYENYESGHASWQPIATPAATVHKLEYDAQIVSGASGIGNSRVAAFLNWEQTGAADMFVTVDIGYGGEVRLAVSVPSGGAPAWGVAAAPTDGLCHHYEAYVVTFGTSRNAILYIDGVQKASAAGVGIVGLPDLIEVGDVAGRECCEPGRGPAPDVAYDNIQFGVYT